MWTGKNVTNKYNIWLSQLVYILLTIDTEVNIIKIRKEVVYVRCISEIILVVAVKYLTWRLDLELQFSNFLKHESQYD